MLALQIIFTLVCLICTAFSKSTELTFELADSAVECFYEDINKDTSVSLDFQVITGGQYDVDVKILSPNQEVIYAKTKIQYDSHQFTTTVSGIHSVCFSNEFSTFSHKLVYFEMSVGPEEPLPGVGEHATALTQMESSAESIHSSLNKIIDDQTHHRLREAQSRKRAEDLNETVLWWAIIETVGVIAVTVGQVVILKNFFSDRPTLYSRM